MTGPCSEVMRTCFQLGSRSGLGSVVIVRVCSHWFLSPPTLAPPPPPAGLQPEQDLQIQIYTLFLCLWVCHYRCSLWWCCLYWTPSSSVHSQLCASGLMETLSTVMDTQTQYEAHEADCGSCTSDIRYNSLERWWSDRTAGCSFVISACQTFRTIWHDAQSWASAVLFQEQSTSTGWI